ncbi:hypothetical protein NCCP1664_04810 [Zafaria cholistanensis]|uniref:Uncharacterized protein n=2 Tax=Zafaria cholistanensis TaxID=1682741 RepID=A0A5A7NM09_9MICC|nr:hypothetical protein NCCP1664_04810 [Zafaria cholistanensis]
MLGWGLFIALLVGLSAPRLGVRPVAAVAVAATAVVVFGLLWALSGRDPGPARPVPDEPLRRSRVR